MANNLRPWIARDIAPASRKLISASLQGGPKEREHRENSSAFWLPVDKPRLVQVIEILSEEGLTAPCFLASDGELHIKAIIPTGVVKELGMNTLQIISSIKGSLLSITKGEVRLQYDNKEPEDEEEYINLHIQKYRNLGNQGGEIFFNPRSLVKQQDFAQVIDLLRECTPKSPRLLDDASPRQSAYTNKTFATQAVQLTPSTLPHPKPSPQRMFDYQIGDDGPAEGETGRVSTKANNVMAPKNISKTTKTTKTLSDEQLLNLIAGKDLGGSQHDATQQPTNGVHATLSTSPHDPMEGIQQGGAEETLTTTRRHIKIVSQQDHAPTSAERAWAGFKVNKRNTTIPNKQQEFLNPAKPESWLPGPPGRRGPWLNIPTDDLNAFTASIDHPSSSDSASDSEEESKSGDQHLAAKPTDLQLQKNKVSSKSITSREPRSPSTSEPDTFVNSQEWPPSSPPHKILPPDSEDEQSRQSRPKQTVHAGQDIAEASAVPQGAVLNTYDLSEDEDSVGADRDVDDKASTDDVRRTIPNDGEEDKIMDDMNEQPEREAVDEHVESEQVVSLVTPAEPSHLQPTRAISVQSEKSSSSKDFTSSPPLAKAPQNHTDQGSNTNNFITQRNDSPASANDGPTETGFTHDSLSQNSRNQSRMDLDRSQMSAHDSSEGEEDRHDMRHVPQSQKSLPASSKFRIRQKGIQLTPAEASQTLAVQVKETPAAYFQRNKGKAIAALSGAIIPATYEDVLPTGVTINSNGKHLPQNHVDQPPDRRHRRGEATNPVTNGLTKRKSDDAGLDSTHNRKQSRVKLGPSMTTLISQKQPDPCLLMANQQRKKAFLAEQAALRRTSHSERQSTEARTLPPGNDLSHTPDRKSTREREYHESHQDHTLFVEQPVETANDYGMTSIKAQAAAPQHTHVHANPTPQPLAMYRDHSSIDESKLPFDSIIEKFFTLYPVYQHHGGNRTHLINMAKEAQRNLPKASRLWDDYVIRYMVDYRSYVLESMMNGVDFEKDYAAYWDSLETGPLHVLRVLNKDNIDLFTADTASAASTVQSPAVDGSGGVITPKPDPGQVIRIQAVREQRSNLSQAPQPARNEDTELANNLPTLQHPSSPVPIAQETNLTNKQTPARGTLDPPASQAARPSSSTRHPTINGERRRQTFGGVAQTRPMPSSEPSGHRGMNGSSKSLSKAGNKLPRHSLPTLTTPSRVQKIVAGSTPGSRESPRPGWSKHIYKDGVKLLSQFSRKT